MTELVTKRLFVVGILMVATLWPASAETMTPPIRHTVRFPDPSSHYAEIEATVPTSGANTVELMMAVWTPGSYLVREYANQIDAVSASSTDGTKREVVKTAKNRWRVATGGEESVRIFYRLYCHHSSVRNNWVDDRYAFLVGAGTFLTLVDDLDRPHEVTVELPDGWKQAVSPLADVEDSTADSSNSPGDHRRRPTFRAENFDQLVDSPLYAGSPTVHPYEVGGVRHWLINEGEGTSWDGPRSARDARRISEELISFWGHVPYPRYAIFNLITEGRGGLEHKDSTVLMTSRWATRTRKSYLNWLRLVSHELFHAWNGKRLRPAALGPFDYENEVYTRDLWVIEGVTSYYDDLLVARSGLSTQKEYLEALSKIIERVQTTPGRRVQPMGDASYDAWIKLYRRDENSNNTTMSYYAKGALVAWLLDARLRHASQGEVSLDTVLRAAFARFSGERGYDEGEFRSLVAEFSGSASEEIDAFLHQALDTTAELDFAPALSWFGLRFEPTDKEDGEKGEEGGWLGLKTRVREGRLEIDEIHRDTPAFTAGLSPGDEILALDGYRVTGKNWQDRLAAFRPGETPELLVSRRQRLVTVPVTFGSQPEPRWSLEVDPEATADQVLRLTAWLGDGLRDTSSAASE